MQPKDKPQALAASPQAEATDQAVEADVFTGHVLGVRNDKVSVNLGLGITAKAPLSEFASAGEGAGLHAGQDIRVTVAAAAGRPALKVPLDKLRLLEAWRHAEQAHAAQRPVQGRITSVTAQGYEVRIGDLSAFMLPDAAAELADEPLETARETPLWFAVREVNAAERRIVVAPWTRARTAERSAQADDADAYDPLGAFLSGTPEGERARLERDAISDVGRWLRGPRRNAGTQEQIAAAAGTNPATLSLIERGPGERGPTVAMISRILFALDRELTAAPLPKRNDMHSLIVLKAAPLDARAHVGPSDGAGAEVLDRFLSDSLEGRRALAERRAIDRIGRIVRQVREAHMSLNAAAKAAGTTPATLSLMERGLGERGPTIGLLARVAHAIGHRLSFQA
jgi:transcriptional regulator with XRE-family HTH domain